MKFVIVPDSFKDRLMPKPMTFQEVVKSKNELLVLGAERMYSLKLIVC